MNSLLKKFNELSDINAHNEAALLLVKNFGTQEEVNTLEEIKRKHEKRGHILYEEQQQRYHISNKYYSRLHK